MRFVKFKEGYVVACPIGTENTIVENVMEPNLEDIWKLQIKTVYKVIDDEQHKDTFTGHLAMSYYL